MDTTIPTDHLTLDALHTPGRREAQRLRNALRLNAATSLAGGLVAAVAPTALDRLLGSGHPGWVRVVGVGLVVYALDLLVLAGSRMTRLLRWTPYVVGADVAWVAASIVGIAAGWLSGPGTAVMAAVGLAVGFFAWRQQRAHLGLRASAEWASTDGTPPFEIAEVRAHVAAPASAMWEVITDHELYGRLAPNLGGVQATGPNGPALTRTCSNRAGEEWHETCTLWDPGHRFAIEVDTSDYPYPLQAMLGEWSVQPAGEGAEVSMRFAFRPRSGVRAGAFALVMQAAFPLVLRRILRGWRHEAREAAKG
jgi:ribosome-associated toxin RatA of RatAB toxin-antitoxin module